jgi:hypothetical protein
VDEFVAAEVQVQRHSRLPVVRLVFIDPSGKQFAVATPAAGLPSLIAVLTEKLDPPKPALSPMGGLDGRKYATICLALGMARGALFSAIHGELQSAQGIMDCTATAKLAQALGCTEAELTVDWNDYLTKDEIDRIMGSPPLSGSS